MIVLAKVLGLLSGILDVVLAVGRWIAAGAIGLMVVVILVQVFYRYVLGNALPWPDEAARFLMLWMTGLIAPSAYRQGGFVSIDLISAVLPNIVARTLSAALLLLALVVLVIGFQLGLKHVNSGWLFNSSTLKLPLDLFGGQPLPIKLAWMYMSLPIGLGLLAVVNVELILRALTGRASANEAEGVT